MENNLSRLSNVFGFTIVICSLIIVGTICRIAWIKLPTEASTSNQDFDKAKFAEEIILTFAKSYSGVHKKKMDKDAEKDFLTFVKNEFQEVDKLDREKVNSKLIEICNVCKHACLLAEQKEVNNICKKDMETSIKYYNEKPEK